MFVLTVEGGNVFEINKLTPTSYFIAAERVDSAPEIKKAKVISLTIYSGEPSDDWVYRLDNGMWLFTDAYFPRASVGDEISWIETDNLWDRRGNTGIIVYIGDKNFNFKQKSQVGYRLQHQEPS